MRKAAVPNRRQGRDALEQSNIIFDRHEKTKFARMTNRGPNRYHGTSL